MIWLSFFLLSGGAMAQFTAANASTYATTPNFLASGSYEYKPDGRSCCTAGTQYSPEYCEDPNSPLGEDEYITACCMDGDNYIVHYANFASKPLNIGLSISDTVSIPNDAVPISVTYNITSVSLDHGTLYAEVTLSVSSIVQLSQTSTISIQLARVYADAGVFDFQIAEGIGAVVVNMQTRVNDDGTIDLKADIIGTSLLAAIESNFEQTIDEGLVKVLISTFGLCDEPSLEECAWLGTAPLCDGECPADGGWTLKREDRYGDGDLCVTGTKVRCCRPRRYLGNCIWYGTAPFCGGECPSGWTEDHQDSCGDGSCCATGHKSLCCPPNPDPEETCEWFGTAPSCDGECPSGWTYRSEDSCGDGSCCWTGNKVYCCH